MVAYRSVYLFPIVSQQDVSAVPVLAHGMTLRRSPIHFSRGARWRLPGSAKRLATGSIEGEVAIDATSGESGNESRDKRMHGEILESAKYPGIVFRPDRVEGKPGPQGALQVKLHGMFAIHGAEHEITVPVDVQAANGKYLATAHFDVPL